VHRVTDIQDCKIRIQQQDRAKLYKPADRYHNGSPRFPGEPHDLSGRRSDQGIFIIRCL